MTNEERFEYINRAKVAFSLYNSVPEHKEWEDVDEDKEEIRCLDAD